VDQVGVKAPGRPTSKMDLSFANLARLYFLGGNPWCNSTDGKESPTDANERRDVRHTGDALPRMFLAVIMDMAAVLLHSLTAKIE
jgi:hypothetical protein